MSGSTPTEIARVFDAIPQVKSRFREDQLQAYLEELFRWNPQLGLISKRGTPGVAAALLRQSVSLWDFVRHAVPRPSMDPMRVADIGAGGGFPGLIWKLLAPEIMVTLIERKSRRAFFLERVAARLALDALEVLEKDAAALAAEPAARASYDLAVMMAVAPPGRLAGVVESLLKPSGMFCTVRTSGEKVVPSLLGDRLSVRECVQADEGVYLLYEKTSESV